MIYIDLYIKLFAINLCIYEVVKLKIIKRGNKLTDQGMNSLKELGNI